MQGEKYRETISRSAEVEFTHKKIFDDGWGEFANIRLRLEPLPRGAGIQFVNQTEGGIVPANMIGGVEEGIREAAKTGVLEGGQSSISRPS
jgi:elongation factor G